MGTPAACFFAVLLVALSPATGVPLEVESRGGGNGGLGGFPSFSSSQSFTRGGSQSFSKAFSSSGAHSFSNSYAVGPDGERRLLHQAFSESSSNASREGGQRASGATRTYSSSGTTADGRVFSESGAETAGSSASSAASDSSSRAYSSSAGPGGSSESGASSSTSSSSSQAAENHAFSSSSSRGGAGDAYGDSGSSDVAESSSQAYAKDNGLVAQRVTESSSKASASSGVAGGGQSSASASATSTASSVGEATSSASAAVFGAPHRLPPLRPVAEVPLLRPVVPIVGELPVLPTRLEEPLDAILLTTPVPLIEEVNLLPINLPPPPPPPPEPLPAHLAPQGNRHTSFQSTPSSLNEKHRKPMAPVRGYPSSPTNEQHHRIPLDSFDNQNRGQASHSLSQQSHAHRESNSHFPSPPTSDQPQLVLIGYQGNQQKKQQHFGAEHHSGSSHTIHGHRTGVGQSESIKNIMESMQSFMKGSSHIESHQESHREAHHTNAHDGGAHRITYEAIVTGEAPEVLYQSQVNNVNGIKENFQQTSNTQSNSNINNIISQIHRETELNKERPHFVVKNQESTSKFSESHSGSITSNPNHKKPHVENVDTVVHSEDNSQFASTGSAFRVPGDTGNKVKPPNGDETVSYASSSSSFHSLERHSDNDKKNDGDRNPGGEKFLMFNGHRYTSEDLASEFNKTRPTFPPPPIPSSIKPQINHVHHAEASTPSFGLQRHPDDKKHNDSPRNSQPPKEPSKNKMGFNGFFGSRYHEFVPPALFDSIEFSKFFFDHYRPGQPLPSAADFAQATSHVPSSFHNSNPRPASPPRNFPTDYFIYPGTITRERDLPDYVTMDLMSMPHGASISSSSQAVSESKLSSALSPRRPTRIQY